MLKGRQTLPLGSHRGEGGCSGRLKLAPRDGKPQLLVFDVREGWEPLCSFLDKTVPDRTVGDGNRLLTCPSLALSPRRRTFPKQEDRRSTLPVFVSRQIRLRFLSRGPAATGLAGPGHRLRRALLPSFFGSQQGFSLFNFQLYTINYPWKHTFLIFPVTLANLRTASLARGCVKNSFGASCLVQLL